MAARKSLMIRGGDIYISSDRKRLLLITDVRNDSSLYYGVSISIGYRSGVVIEKMNGLSRSEIQLSYIKCLNPFLFKNCMEVIEKANEVIDNYLVDSVIWPLNENQDLFVGSCFRRKDDKNIVFVTSKDSKNLYLDSINLKDDNFVSTESFNIDIIQFCNLYGRSDISLYNNISREIKKVHKGIKSILTHAVLDL